MTKTDFDNSVSSLDSKIVANKTKITSNEHELKKPKTFVKSHFEENGTQNYLVFQSINRYFKEITKNDYVSSWKWK